MRTLVILGFAALCCNSLMGQKISLSGNAKGIKANSLNVAIRHIASNDTIYVEKSEGPFGTSDSFDINFRSEGNYEVIFAATPRKQDAEVEKSFFVLINKNSPRKEEIELQLNFRPANDALAMYLLWDDEGILLANKDKKQYALALSSFLIQGK